MTTQTLLKPYEIAEKLGVHKLTVTGWARKGQVKSIRTPGGHYLIPQSEADRLLLIHGKRT